MKDLKKLLIGLAETFGTSLSEQRMSIYVEILKDVPIVELQRAVKEILTDPAQKFFPLPAAILERVAPQLDPEHEAIEAANRVVQAMADFGWNCPAEAEVFIGSLGWKIVEREGGWAHLCESVMRSEIPTRRAQWRELAKAIQARAKAGLDHAPQLPGEGNAVVRQLADRLHIGSKR